MLRIGGTIIDNVGRRGSVLHQNPNGQYVVQFRNSDGTVSVKQYWRKEIRDVDELPYSGPDAHGYEPDEPRENPFVKPEDIPQFEYELSDNDGPSLEDYPERDTDGEAVWASPTETDVARAFDWKPPILHPHPVDAVRARIFETGATRSPEDGKYRYDRFFSPDVLRRRAKYMHQHRIQSDGQIRDPDNWKKGIPIESYIDSMLRHVVELWLYYYGETDGEVYDDLEAKLDTLCAIMFNCEGLMYEEMKKA